MEFAELVRIGREPTPTDLQPVIVEILEQHRSLKRVELIRELERTWKEAGGAPMSGVLAKVKRVLQQLVAVGIVAPAGTFGVWALVTTDAESEPEFEYTADEFEDDPPPAPDIEIGSGAQVVYCFYLPLYRRQVEVSGGSQWPIKIGMTTGSLAGRLAQLATSMPEAPQLALVIRTENAALLEKVIHGVLAYRKQRHDAAGGAEWFLTNIDEIRSIYDFVTGSPHGA